MEGAAGKGQQAKQGDSRQKQVGMLARPSRKHLGFGLIKTVHHGDGRTCFAVSLTLQQKDSSTDSESKAEYTEVIRQKINV